MAIRLVLAAALLTIATSAALVTVPSPTVLPSTWLVSGSMNNAVPSPAGDLIAVQFTSDVRQAGTNLTLMDSATGSTIASVSFSTAISGVYWVTDTIVAVVTANSIQAVSTTALTTPLWTLSSGSSIVSSTLVNASLLYFTYGDSSDAITSSNVINLYTGKILWSTMIVTSMTGSTLFCTTSLWCGLFVSPTSTFFVIDALNSSTLASVAIPVSASAVVTVALGADSDCVAVDCAVSFATATSVSVVTIQQLPKMWKANVARTFTLADDLLSAVLPIPPFSTNVNLPWLVAIAFGRNVTIYNVADGSVVGEIVTVLSNQADNPVIGMVAVPKSASVTTFVVLPAPNNTALVPSAIAAAISLNAASGNMTVTPVWTTSVSAFTTGFPVQTVAWNGKVYLPLAGFEGTSNSLLIDLHSGTTAYRASLLHSFSVYYVGTPFIVGSNVVVQNDQSIGSFELAVTSTVISTQPGLTQSMVYSTSESTAVALQSSATNTLITCITGANTASPSLSSTTTIPLVAAAGVAANSFYALSPNSDGISTTVYQFDVSTSTPVQQSAVSIPLVPSSGINSVQLMATATTDGLTVLAWSMNGRTVYVLTKGQPAKTVTFNSDITTVVADGTQFYVVTASDFIAYSASTSKVQWTAAGYGGSTARVELGPVFNQTETLAHYSSTPDVFVVRDRATGRALFTWDGPSCVGPIRHFRGDYFVVVTNFQATPASQSYLFHLNLAAPESSGYYPLYDVPQTPTMMVFSPQGIVAISGSQNLVVLNLFSGATMWTRGVPLAYQSGFGLIQLSADGNNLLVFTMYNSPGIDVSVINMFTGVTTLRMTGTSWHSIESLVGTGGCNSFILSSMMSGSIVQYSCLPIPAVVVPKNWNAKGALPGPTNPFTFPPVTNAPAGTSSMAPTISTTAAPHKKKDDDGSSNHVVVIALVVAFVLVGGGIGLFVLQRRRRARQQDYGYGVIRDDRSMASNVV